MKIPLTSSLIVLAISSGVAAKPEQCRCLPGDACWPSTATWSTLNSTIGGKLVATVPIGSPCHDPTYNATTCKVLQDQWTNPLTHIPSSHSIMQSYFANQSCDPFTDRIVPCKLGNYAAFSVKVTDSGDIVAALNFAKEHNVRVLVRNTGHDFLGRSTGAGALAIWTQSLKNISFGQWSDKYYKGPSVTVGAGVIGYEVLEAANAQGMTVVSGECPTVGLAGGFTQAGGHSVLSTQFGLAADQTLSFQVVTANGKLVTASATQNTDLYWALSGGGGGTYGVVVSMTVRAYKSTQVGGAAMQLLASSITPEKFAAATAKFHELMPAMIDAGAMVVFLQSSQYLVFKPVTVWNSTAAYVKDVVMAPFSKALVDLGITPPIAYSELSYRDHYDRYMGPLPRGGYEVTRYQFGGRLIPRAVLENNTAELVKVYADLAANGVLLAGSSANYKKPSGAPDNAVIPAWRKTITQLQMITNWDSTAPWADMEAAQARLTNEFVPKIEAITPGSGSYMNEADFRQPNWQSTFFGSNFNRLSAIKKKYDPENMFYILKGVGSDAWTVSRDGRMCRTVRGN
ncbi:FAD binding domain-containing protein [Plenodomus tracheiphilus IPT5]|uniref:FAD binding domain-containing protein n=1 Tax=Plenodomus tracheiphilus IPT5 TaxID=1408161 RepID=A0A6A7B3M5_9PLEO|nr:FAD binding domain-containing protein [Plenodomus tracheiphilus IPT5]